MTFKEFFSLRKNSFFWINLLLMIVVVAVLIFGTLYALDKYTNHGQSVEVPDVKGMSVAEARQTFKKKGLKTGIMDSTYVRGLTPGSILEQSPASGMRVKTGRTIYLSINTLSVPLLPVPDVADNSSLRQAQAKLTAVGFKLTDEEYIDGEKDWVYGVKYNGRELMSDDKVPVGATLTLLVGRGYYHMEDSVSSPSSSYSRSYDNYEYSTPPRVESAAEPIVDDSWF